MTRLAEILFALLGLALLHWGIQTGLRKAGTSIGKLIGAALRPLLRRSLTAYYTKKVTRQMQEQRRADGVPPLENPHLD